MHKVRASHEARLYQAGEHIDVMVYLVNAADSLQEITHRHTVLSRKARRLPRRDVYISICFCQANSAGETKLGGQESSVHSISRAHPIYRFRPWHIIDTTTDVNDMTQIHLSSHLTVEPSAPPPSCVHAR